MKKKHLLILFAALLSLAASAQTKVEIDGIWYNLISKAKQAEVTYEGSIVDGYLGEYSGSINLPATVTHEGKEYSVTSIGDYAFYCCTSLTEITIPKDVTSIGERAFSYCTNLTAINIPESVTSIGDYAFSRCSSLTAINIPEGVTSIEDYAFYLCSSLTDINLPEGVTSIGNDAFYGCSSLTAINLPESVTSIGDYAFYNCSSLTAINIPEGVTRIEEDAFSGCSSLTAITLPKGVTSIGSWAFSYCHSLTAITIPESVTRIEWGAFHDCSKLATITIPEGAFIDNKVFYGCNSLTAIVLPKSLNGICSEAFANCSELLDVYCYAEMVPGAEADVFNGSYPEYATLHVPAKALDAYKTTVPWSSFGKFETFEVTVENITLNQSTATLTEGETLVLTATVTPDDAADKSISWSSSDEDVATVNNAGKVTAVAPGTATITAMANDGSGVSASCEVTVNELILGKCATPAISYEDGKISLTCDTEDATIRSSVRDNNIGDYEVTEYNVIPTYTITAYATKEKYEDSDVATLTLCWIPCNGEHESEETGILTIPAKPVLISTQGGTITLTGLAEGTAVAAYSTAGTLLATATATDGTATLATNLEAGSIAIVKMGDYSIRIAIK